MPNNNEEFDVTVNASDHQKDWSQLADSELHQIPDRDERQRERSRRRRAAVQQVFEDTKIDSMSEAPRAYDKVLRRIDAVTMGHAMRGANTHRFIAAPGGVVAFERKTGRAVGHLQWDRNDGGIDIMHVDNDSLNLGLTAMGLLKSGWEAARRTGTAGPTKTSAMTDYSFALTNILFPEYIERQDPDRRDRNSRIDPDTGRNFGYQIRSGEHRDQTRLTNQGDYDRISNSLRGTIPGSLSDTNVRADDFNSFAFNAGRITDRGASNSVTRAVGGTETNLEVDSAEIRSPQENLERSVANSTTGGFNVGTEEEYPRTATNSEHEGCIHCDGNSIIRLHPSISEDDLSRADDIVLDDDLRNHFENSSNTRTWTSEHHSDASVSLRDDEVGNRGVLNLIRDGDDEDRVNDIFLTVPCAGRRASRVRTRDF